jgi:hypothetical protein
MSNTLKIILIIWAVGNVLAPAFLCLIGGGIRKPNDTDPDEELKEVWA